MPKQPMPDDVVVAEPINVYAEHDGAAAAGNNDQAAGGGGGGVAVPMAREVTEDASAIKAKVEQVLAELKKISNSSSTKAILKVLKKIQQRPDFETLRPVIMPAMMQALQQALKRYHTTTKREVVKGLKELFNTAHTYMQTGRMPADMLQRLDDLWNQAAKIQGKVENGRYIPTRTMGMFLAVIKRTFSPTFTSLDDLHRDFLERDTVVEKQAMMLDGLYRVDRDLFIALLAKINPVALRYIAAQIDQSSFAGSEKYALLQQEILNALQLRPIDAIPVTASPASASPVRRLNSLLQKKLPVMNKLKELVRALVDTGGALCTNADAQKAMMRFGDLGSKTSSERTVEERLAMALFMQSKLAEKGLTARYNEITLLIKNAVKALGVEGCIQADRFDDNPWLTSSNFHMQDFRDRGWQRRRIDPRGVVNQLLSMRLFRDLDKNDDLKEIGREIPDLFGIPDYTIDKQLRILRVILASPSFQKFKQYLMPEMLIMMRRIAYGYNASTREEDARIPRPLYNFLGDALRDVRAAGVVSLKTLKAFQDLYAQDYQLYRSCVVGKLIELLGKIIDPAFSERAYARFVDEAMVVHCVARPEVLPQAKVLLTAEKVEKPEVPVATLYAGRAATSVPIGADGWPVAAPSNAADLLAPASRQQRRPARRQKKQARKVVSHEEMQQRAAVFMLKAPKDQLVQLKKIYKEDRTKDHGNMQRFLTHVTGQLDGLAAYLDSVKEIQSEEQSAFIAALDEAIQDHKPVVDASQVATANNASRVTTTTRGQGASEGQPSSVQSANTVQERVALTG